MRKFSSFLVFIALLIVAATMVPFVMDTVSNNEIVLKFIVFPLTILLISFILIIGKDKKVEGKRGFYGADLILSAYVASVFVYIISLMLRSGMELIPFVGCCASAFLFTLLAVLLPKFEHKKAIYVPILFTFMIVAFIGYAYSFNSLNVKYEKNIIYCYAIPGGVALLTTIIYLIQHGVMTKKLIETNMERDVVLYQEILDDNLKDIYDYSKDELQNRGIAFEEAKKEVIKEVPVEKIIDREIVREVPVDRVVEKEVEVVKEVPIPQYVEKEVVKEVPVIKEVEVVKEVPVIKEVEKVVEKVVEVVKEVPVEKPVEKVIIREIPVEKVVEVVKEVPVEKIVEVVKEVPVEHVIEVKADKKPTVKKEKLNVKPSPSDIAIKAEKMYSDIEIKYGKDEENYKILYHGKVIMMVAGGNNGYKVTYQRKPISATKFMIKYPEFCQKASTPQGEQWFKITNKGDIEDNDIYSLIEFSHKYTEEVEAKEAAKKAKALAKAKAQKEKEKEAERKAKEKERLALEKAKAKEEAKAKADAEKEAAKAKAAEERAAARAKAAEERAAAKAKAKEEAKLAKENAAVVEVLEATPVEAPQGNTVHTVTTTTITQTVETVEGPAVDINKEAIKAAVREALAEHEAEKNENN